MKRALAALILAAGAFTWSAAMATQRFLGPPVKKPADLDAGVASAGEDAFAAGAKVDEGTAGAKADAGTAGARVDAAAGHHAAADPPILKVGDDAPPFSGVLHNPDEAGMPRIDLSSLVGSEADADPPAKAVLISFFATWCKPCKKELPFLQQLSTEYKASGLRVLSIAIDKDEAAWPAIKALVALNHVTFPIVKDRYNLIARQYLGDKTTLPSVFIVAHDGTVSLVKQGYPDDAAQFLKAEVEKALAR